MLITCFFFFAIQAQAIQGVQVSGVVRDTEGPLPGVSIRVKGAAQSLGQTNDQGLFKLNVEPNITLVFSYIGYAAKEVALSEFTPDAQGNYSLNVEMEKGDGTNLEEVVVVGFGTQKKVNMTAAVSSIDSKALESRPVQNATQALQGLVPGLNISQNNGSLESTASVNIRGTGTIGTSSSDPLILVDGMEGSLNAINPQDIESISVLKDASAAAVYGSRAAFGVILVTTKKGKAGKAQFNYNNNLRYTRPVLLPKQMDSYTFALYFNDAQTNGGNAAFFSDEHLQRILDYQAGTLTSSIPVSSSNSQYWADGYAEGNANVDWYKAMYRNQSFSHEHNVSLTGGGEKTTYYVSGNMMKQDGLMQFNQDFYNRYGITAKINNKINDYIQANYSTRFLREEYERPSNLTTTFYQDLARQGWPTLPLYDPNGYLYSSPSPALGMRDGGDDKQVKDWSYHQLQLVLEPIKGWKTFAELNYRMTYTNRHWDLQQLYNHDVNGEPYLYSASSNVYEYAYKENYYNINAYSEYTKDFNEVHHFKAMAGFQTESTGYRDVGVQRNGIIVPNVSTINTTSGTDANGDPLTPSVSGQYQQWKTAGFFGRLNYDYKGKYLVEGNLRYDGSSRFRAAKRWGLFPSISAGWNMAQEGFWENMKDKVELFKLRASYGQLGNQNTDVWYPTYVTMPVGTSNGTWLVNGSQPNTSNAPGLVSSTLTWETIKSVDVGLDFSMFNGKLSGAFDWYERKTLDMVGPAIEMPVTLGTSVPQTNNTDLKSNGFDLELSWRDRLENGLGYNMRFVLSDYQTTITRYPNDTRLLSTYRSGQKMGEIWGYETIGIAKTQAEMDDHLASLPNGGQNALGSNWAAGDIMYADLNGDGKIDNGANTESDHGDLKVIGNSTPRYSFSFDLSLDWKGFDFRALFQGVMKRDYWQGSYFFWGASSGGIWWSTGLKEHEDYFRSDESHPLGQNLDSYYPRPLFNGKNQQTQTRYLQNAAYIRLKNIQLGYSLPKSITQKWGGQNLRVFVSGENLWTGTETATMFDPETIDGGSDGSVYPLSRVISFGLNMTF